MKINFLTTVPKNAHLRVLVLSEGAALPVWAEALDASAQGRLKAAIKAAKFTGKRDQLIEILAPTAAVDRLILVGAGDVDKATNLNWEMTGGVIAARLLEIKAGAASVALGLGKIKPGREAQVAALLASGASLRNYRFDAYKTKKKDSVALSDLGFVCADARRAEAAFASLQAVAQGVHLARDLVNEPANILFPVEFANRIKKLAQHGVKIEILTPSQMQKLGMGALLGVAQGSTFEPRLVVMRWDGGKKSDKPVAFVGKGVTFDTGGVSIKPSGGMEDMKGDMGGAAAVTGLMLALAKRKAKANVIGAVGLVENAVDGQAQRPGDIVKSMSGQTIAVLNTDAEGRLVLADVCWYIQDRFKPRFMVDLATLTGAIGVALGREHAGLFANDDKLAKHLIAAGLETGEKLWRMPLSPEYDKAIDSDVADMKNIGSRHGGAITGAQFIQRFVNKVPWAHLDIANTAFDAPRTSISPGWASGFGVRLLDRLVRDYVEA